LAREAKTHDAIIASISYKNSSTGNTKQGSDPLRRIHLAVAASICAELAKKSAVRGEHSYSVVAAIDNVDAGRSIRQISDSRAMWIIELAGLRAHFPERTNKGACGIELHDTMIASVGHINIQQSVHCDSHRSIEFSGT